MRPSNKSRSRNKNQNQNRRPAANVINRVFDSSGPEGKVRGTPQQIIDKYQALARDAQLAGDRVAAENFLQHSEHYARLLSEATREQNQRREQQEAQQAAQQAQQQAQNQNQNPNQNQRRDQQPHQQPDETHAPDLQNAEQPDIASPSLTVENGDAGLVETPEAKAADTAPQADAEAPKAKKPVRRRKPVKQDAPEEAAE